MKVFIIKCNNVVEYVYLGDDTEANVKMLELRDADYWNKQPIRIYDYGDVYNWACYEIKKHNMETENEPR